MEVIGATEVRANFAAILRRVASQGERIAIERRGKPCAVMVPVEDIEYAEQSAARPLRKTDTLFNETERLAKLGHWEWDEVADRCTYCSDELARMHGVTVEEYLQKSTSLAADVDWVHPRDRQRYLEVAARATQAGEGFEIEYRLVQPGGGFIEVREKSEPIFDDKGRMIRSHGFVQDITAEKRADEALRQNEVLLRHAMRTAGMGAWVWDDAKDECIYCSEELALIFGQSVDQYMATRSGGSGLTVAIHPDDREFYQQSVDDAARTRSWYDVEFREKTADGSYHDFREIGEPMADPVGGRMISVGIVQDITDAKRRERDLRANQAEMDRAQRQAKIGSWRWDVPANRLISCSGEYARIHGVTIEEAPDLLADQMKRVVHPDDRSRVEAEFERFDETGVDFEIEYRIVRPDGAVRHLLEIGEAVRDKKGRVIEQTGTVQDVTERKLVEEELRRSRDELEERVEQRTAQLRTSESRYRNIFNTAAAGIGRTSLKDGRILLSNQKLAEMFGYDWVDAFAAEFVFSEHYKRPEDRDRLTGIYRESPGTPVDVRLSRRDGSTLLIRAHGTVDHAEGFLEFVAIDITAQEQAEAASRRNEAYLRALIDANPSAIFLKDPAGRYVIINHAYEKMLGLAKEDILGKKIGELGILSDSYVMGINALDKEVIETGKVIQEEHYPTLPDGSTPTTILTKFPIMDSSGALTGVGSMETDITAQKRVEQKLRDSEKRLREAQRIARLGHWELGSDGLLDWSDEVFRIFGVDPDRFDGTTGLFYELVHPDDRDLVKETTAEAWVKGGPYVCAHRVVRPDGEIRTVRESAEIILDENGQAIRSSGTVQDITDQVNAEARLRQAQKMEAVGQLTGGIAHDFNNLLAVILGSAEFLEEDMCYDEEMVRTILRAAKRGADLTHHLLAYSRQQPLRTKSVDLRVLTAGMSALLTRTLGETITVETLVAPDLWTAAADPAQVENAILNLSINARDAMPAGGQLTIECQNVHLDQASVAQHSEPVTGDFVLLSVTDSGTGMSAEVREHAFEPFFTTKEVGKGSGLGLSMVYGFAQQSGGLVNIYSEAGHGTTVKLYLPRDSSEVQETGAKDVRDLPLGRGEAILVIEDDPEVRAFAVKALKGLGYEVTDVPEAAAARGLLAGGARFDLVLSDVVLPGGVSGPEFAEEIRERYPTLKVIFMSGYPAEAAKRNGFLGSDRVLLNKPFQRRQLAKALRDALD